MHVRNKILSHFLLAIYLLAIVHQSVSHKHDLTTNAIPSSDSSHKHEDFSEVHHEHEFHVGIFHFLGHLLEQINHADDLADEHLINVQKTFTKKVVDRNNSVDVFFDCQQEMAYEVDAESLPDPPYHLSILQKLKLPSTPLRAPPSLV